MDEISFKINGFHCSSCVKAATMKIKKINGVLDVDIKEDGSSRITSSRTINTGEIAKALEGLDYTVEVN